MTDLLGEVQIPFLATLLLIASAAKVPGGDRDDPATVLHNGRAFGVTVTIIEAALGVLLMITSLGTVRLATVVFFATATSVVAELARRGSVKGCGCFGGLSRTPPGRQSVARAALLTIAAIASAGVPKTGVEVLWDAEWVTVVLLAAEFVLLLTLSPEVTAAVRRARRPVPCDRRDIPLPATYATLRGSDAWRSHAALLTSAEPAEVWRELCHRYVVFRAEVDERPVEVVFAVPVDGRRSGVRAAVLGKPGTEHQDDGSGPQRVPSSV